MLKHVVLVAVVSLVLPMSAAAAPFLKGKIVSSGASRNNLTTAVPFSIPVGPVSIFCDADVYFVAGGTSAVVANSDGFPLNADSEKTMNAVNGGTVFAIIPVSGSATCKVFQLSGETISYRGSGVSPGSIVTSVEESGALLRANEYALASAFIASVTSNTDGGVGGKYSLIANRDSCVLLGAAAGVTEICADGIKLVVKATMETQTLQSPQFTCPQGQNCNTYASPGNWYGPRPDSNLTGCKGTASGGLKMNASDGGYVYCDGAAVQKLASIVDHTASVDFEELDQLEQDFETMPLPGAQPGRSITCSPIGSLPAGIALDGWTVADAGTATLYAHRYASGTADPAAFSVNCSQPR